MVFTRLGYIFAIFTLLLGILSFGLGLLAEFDNSLVPIVRYEPLIKGLYMVIVGLVLGVLTEIRYALGVTRSTW